ncbi:lysozyme [Larkinella arboricola]|uniref:Lysozyme n=1 Tax=Larkinella arboricola TaxID=643671 RepID=A0A327X085_LARAB|nr:GH25 family lysozyme [Larkinella arboricola]RAJ99870.1 lysozyme [Larkinella arboricola]
MSQIVLYLYRKRKYFRWPFLALCLLLVGLWWYRSLENVNELQWQYVNGYGIRMPLKYTIHGIDVSHHNSRINWKRVCQAQANGVSLQFVFVKATEGATLVDRRFKHNWKEAGKVGLKRGAYHFYHPKRDPAKQARNFIKTVTLKPGDFAPVLDIERNDKGRVPADKLIADIRIWLRLVEDHYGMKPIIYVNRHFYLLYIAGNFDDYPLWLADYSSDHPDQFKADRLYIWQHNEKGSVDGIRGKVDFNVFVCEPERLKEICL